MKRGFTRLAFTTAVEQTQQRLGARARNRDLETIDTGRDRITPDLAAFVAARDSFFLATGSREGQPYIQHRGGPPGFLAVLDERRLGFVDLEGNRQYITLGNLSENPKALLFLMDWANRRRVKIWGEARFVEADNAENEALIERLQTAKLNRAATRAIIFEVAAWDLNCPQHIPQLFGLADVEAASAAMLARIAELEAEVEQLRKKR
ncbi:MAG TPA: pyridoxamine 5'-phosphate oxidase family protein [Dongiaceae bacterium]|nr:pyridoxamine 5'-phosphate oxidase family protein [Dongiaceae bacterium]